MKRPKDVNHRVHNLPFCDSHEFINRFEVHLSRRGHTQSTKQAYLSSTKHFCSWLETRSWSGDKICKKSVQQFLQEHLPVCCCQGPIYKDFKTVRAALNQVLSMEGCDQIRPINRVKFPGIEAEIDRFDKYLQKICGHAEATRWYHRRHIREFLIWLFGGQCICPDKVTGERLCRFVSKKSTSLHPNSIGVLVYSLHAYLRFLQLNGYVTPALAATIPRPPNWSKVSLPCTLSRDELSRFWSVFNLKTSVGKRDYAMARCLLDLGLRCYEVSAIQIEDIDWHNCVLQLPKTKSRRQETLPIPDKMGRALVTYLRYGRPQTKSRFVFVFHRAPIGQGVQNTTVRGVIRRAFSRADLPWSGTHILRSTVASRLLEGGASLKEIADVLRHRSIDTTKSYTKINLSQLAQVALPWPGRSS